MTQKPLRRISVLLLRLGVVGLFVAAATLSLTGFALFGCQSCESNNGPSRNVEGMTVNPPDLSASQKSR